MVRLQVLILIGSVLLELFAKQLDLMKMLLITWEYIFKVLYIEGKFRKYLLVQTLTIFVMSI